LLELLASYGEPTRLPVELLFLSLLLARLSAKLLVLHVGKKKKHFACHGVLPLQAAAKFFVTKLNEL
jgi:hypothetical protein